MAKKDSLFPILEPKPLAGLAARAAEAPLDSTGCLTEYRPLASRSILNKTTSRRGLPFTHAINPYRGCEFGCRYCYARYTHEFMEMAPKEFEQKIYFKQNAAWLLEQELKALKPGTVIALGTATDPYQPLERRQRVTRSLLEVFARHSGFRLGIVTKSPLIVRDLDLLKQISERNRLTVHLTVTTTDLKLARILEPRAPRPDLRMRAVARLREAGLRAGVMCSPLMPGITDGFASLDAVARAAADAGASFFVSGALFLKPCSLPTFFSFVEKHFPGQIEAYRKRYEKSAFVSPAYRKRVAEMVGAVCRKYSLERLREEDAPGGEDAGGEVALQPWLPFGTGAAFRTGSAGCPD
jgi:DNA repair photolyase